MCQSFCISFLSRTAMYKKTYNHFFSFECWKVMKFALLLIEFVFVKRKDTAAQVSLQVRLNFKAAQHPCCLF